ncbi:hypothetical protein ABZT06_41485 [Streptomyces sp. NPDC005483]|uniref:hypothetical protein n=1 Tax=Streptomyces sp. NPDC005483 TaxID=3154882 RepID=UPI00339E5164
MTGPFLACVALSATAPLDAATDLHNGTEVAQGESGHPTGHGSGHLKGYDAGD